MTSAVSEAVYDVVVVELNG
ncbi:unnamed protein product [Leptidea sinapis]|uniref:Uncharacterized protein n=1 Tax=Leptidea sinapis TaxID=189913 RepID=A0A5E4Q8V9_9NEOP|nr:unnamed protein product [Leptidea sinapis]